MTEFLFRRKAILSCIGLGIVGMAGVAIAGFMASSFGVRLENGDHLIRLPRPGQNGGITHGLDPSAWYAFRVKIKHADAAFPTLGWASDNFAPTGETLQICNESGCEAPEINAGIEKLDWSDTSRVTLFLEAKTCMLCGWQSFPVSLPPS